MSCTAFTYGVHLEQLPEELHDLPDKAHKAALVAKVVTNIICRFIRCVGCGFFGSGLFEFVSATVITLIVTVSILVFESGNNFLFNLIVASCTMFTLCKTCFAALGSNCFVDNYIVLKSFDSLFVCFTATVVTNSYFFTCYTALCFFGYFVLCEGVFEC